MGKGMRYVIIGPPDPESNNNLYWSNDTGWGSFEGCSNFPPEILNRPLPIETTAVAELTTDNKLGKVFALVTPLGGGC